MATLTSPPPAPTKSTHGEAKLPEFKKLPELASAQLGGRVLFSTDDWFAAADNLIESADPIFIVDKFTEFGKWMDGWETRRKRIPGHDWAIVRLGMPGIIQGIELSTAFFTGNFTPRVSIQGACLEEGNAEEAQLERTRPHGVMGTAATPEQQSAAAALGSEKWVELVSFTPLGAGYSETHRNFFRVNHPHRVTHLRVNMFPDGGIARMRVHGTIRRDWSKVSPTEVVDLAAATSGGTVLSVSNSHYGMHTNLIAPNRGVNMGDGWETRRRKDRPAVLKPDASGMLQMPEFDWCVLKLGHEGYIREFEVDTNHFKGNFPESCRVEGVYAPDSGNDAFADGEPPAGMQWTPVLPRSKLGPNQQHTFLAAGAAKKPFTHLRLCMFPDGGISRFRVYGSLAPPSKL